LNISYTNIILKFQIMSFCTIEKDVDDAIVDSMIARLTDPQATQEDRAAIWGVNINSKPKKPYQYPVLPDLMCREKKGGGKWKFSLPPKHFHTAAKNSPKWWQTVVGGRPYWTACEIEKNEIISWFKSK
jgi:hypothetical protein